ncbi:hypothetical protein PPL_05179 [Heterostelium album PN500]|uniref:GATA-type domain-containing protein n=1 Tax=Heterostelium pallidum (strain ATCC 26659 / Pp 5 / PN500) TaxID=670386 RepID=D3B9N3_HETP5|nr:hypothetical protein PPL_05179 [Heterostelium album PN500]EFA81945.1 hypothetical protein PPL_05179 [Heterostelium album PN500]|eukprot:XP_020434062.1 hypothetical protein PPL_05179 [Heterostelium album PN500]
MEINQFLNYHNCVNQNNLISNYNFNFYSPSLLVCPTSLNNQVTVKRRRGRPPKEEKKHRTCARCGTSDTSEWRKPNNEFLCYIKITD